MARLDRLVVLGVAQVDVDLLARQQVDEELVRAAVGVLDGDDARPGVSSVNSVPETAAMPDAKAIACSAPSRSAILRSNARTVGLVLRE